MKNSHSAIKSIEYILPNKTLTNDMLVNDFPDWSIEKIYEKTGIKQRHITSSDICASDLGVAAAHKMFDSGICHPHDIDFILFCTQSPDYLLPTTACLIQTRLNIPTHAGALDFNLGCSGFIYGLSLAHGLISTNQAKNVLLITADTYSKYIKENDRVNRTIFSDGAAATLISQTTGDESCIGPFVLGSDGRGAQNLIVKTGGAKQPSCAINQPTLFMNGPEIFTFTLNVVPKMINDLYIKAQINTTDVDFYIFHQANIYMLECLRKKMLIPKEKMLYFIENCGNTVSSTIPITLHEYIKNGQIKSGMNIMLIGFGVGYSWGATCIKIP